MSRGFQKGHPKFEPKLRAMRTRQLASAVRDTVSVDVMVWFHQAVAMGKDARLTDEEEGPNAAKWWDDECELGVTWPEHGIAPSLEQRQASMRWLADRGHGQAAQMIAIEASLRGDATLTSGSIFDLLSPATILGVRELLQRNELPGTSTSTSDGHTSGDAYGGTPALIEATGIKRATSDEDPLPDASGNHDTGTDTGTSDGET